MRESRETSGLANRVAIRAWLKLRVPSGTRQGEQHGKCPAHPFSRAGILPQTPAGFRNALLAPSPESIRPEETLQIIALAKVVLAVVSRRMIALLIMLASAVAARPDIPSNEFILAFSAGKTSAIREDAIDRSAMSVNWFFRGFARNRLREVTTACKAYRLVIDAPKFEVYCEGKQVFRWTMGQTGTWTTETGDVVDVDLSYDESSYTLVFDSPGGSKTFNYAYLGNDRLRVTQTIESSRLPTPVSYSLEYTKKVDSQDQH